MKNPEKFEYFCWEHFSEHLKYPIADFHQELIGLIEHQRIAIAAPRGFAKSTYFSLFYPLFKALETPGSRIMIISATATLAEEWLSKIKKELEENISLKEYYANKKGDRWTTQEIKIKIEDQTSTISAKGAGRQIRGFRPTLIVCDDLETEEIVANPELLKNFNKWFWTDVVGTLMPGSQLILVGTILDPDSFLADLTTHGRHKWETRFYQAVKDAPRENNKLDLWRGESLWPAQWPLNELYDRFKEMGEYAFYQEYMNDPIKEEHRKFQKKWIKYYETNPEIANKKSRRLMSKGLTHFTMIDPAISINKGSDYTAIVTVAVDHEENIYVVDVINKRLLPSETVDTIFQVYNRFKSAVVAIESVGFQDMLRHEIQKQKKVRHEYPLVKELKSGGRRKQLRIEAMQPRFESGSIYIRENMTELETQLLRFPSPRCHDDIIDALAYCLDIIRPTTKVQKSLNPDCFLATIERRRNKTSSGEAWGNHKLRGHG